MSVRLWLQRILVLLFAAGSVFYAVQAYKSTFGLGAVGDTSIDKWEKRFVDLKEQLPVKNGVVGYVADFDIKGVESNIADQEAEYILAQYTMAPVVLERSTDHEWVIGNLSPQAFEIWNNSQAGQFEVFGFGKDLYLFHKVGQ